MLDDDIEYIGSRAAQRAPSVSDSLIHHHPVTGLTLHIEKNGSNPAYDMVFRKSSSSVIQIGRRPGSENKRRDPGKAMFRCPVVSRKHAKIAFSDAGSVYLFDLGSHHGTHVRRPEEIFSRMLRSESPWSLSGGEFVTLGKSVGKGDDLVRPIVFRIELHRSESSPSAPIDLTRTVSSESVNTSVKSVPVKSSGRYGLNDTSSTSSDEMSSLYVNDISSDNEDMSLPSSQKDSIRSQADESVHSGSHFGHAFEVLKRLIPPLHPPLPSQRDRTFTDGPSSSFVFPPLYVPHWVSPPPHLRFLHSPPITLPPLILQPTDDAQEQDNTDWTKLYMEGDDEQLSNKSRSTSPMDLASPSPAPLIPDCVSAPDPAVVGAWPNSRLHSPAPSNSSSLYVECGVPYMTANKESSKDDDYISTPAQNLNPEQEPTTSDPTETPNQPVVSQVEQSDSELLPPQEGIISNNEEVDDLKYEVNKLKDDVTKLQLSHADIRGLVNTELDDLIAKLGSVEKRLTGLNDDWRGCMKNVDSSIHAEIPKIQDNLNLLQAQFNSFAESRFSSAHGTVADTKQNGLELLHERADVKESIETLHLLVLDMSILRDKTQQQMAAELEAVRAARNTAIANIVVTMSKPMNETPTPTTLKRKRDDEDEEEEGTENVKENGEVPQECAMDVVENGTSLDSTVGPNVDGIIVPTPKRARRVASAVVQTATAVALGAIATWSALAFT
ncbi:hypothetical protein AX17_007273 [Amanita inopinata Kibby_2008]|nr:hypothetical protein AX17_007273 [Amanita inopinata Kibby_2008]